MGLLTGSDLFALASDTRNAGEEMCHYCGSACGRLLTHDDPPPVPFVRTKSVAKYPRNPFICNGCWVWKRKRVTVTFLGSGKYQDNQTAADHSWWLTPAEAKAIHPASHPALYPLLLSPPPQFAMALRTDPTIPTYLQCVEANDNEEVLADTPLRYTVNNVVHTFTVYELEHALRHGLNGKAAGVRELVKLLGDPPADLLPEEDPQKRHEGRNARPGGDAKNLVKKPVTKKTG